MSDTIDAGKNKSTSLSNPLVFLNTPICDNVEDVIGFQSHVDTLQAAINENAQMIAITSPFGAGKSSVTELLRTKKDNQRVVNVSMWSHLCKKEDTDGIRGSSNLQKSYVEAVNKAVEKSITSSTVKCICAFSTLYGLNDSVTSKLYTAKKYKYYVLCKALYIHGKKRIRKRFAL